MGCGCKGQKDGFDVLDRSTETVIGHGQNLQEAQQIGADSGVRFAIKPGNAGA